MKDVNMALLVVPNKTLPSERWSWQETNSPGLKTAEHKFLQRFDMSYRSFNLSMDGAARDSGRSAITENGAVEQFLKLGRYLLALPMLIFPVFHFTETKFVASIVPPWIPWHVFWTYFTACTLMGAGLCIVFNKYARVPSVLLGIEIFLFVVLIHLALIFHKPGDVWAERLLVESFPGELNNCFKDLGVSGAAFIFAGTLSASFRSTGRDIFLAIGRTILGFCIAAFGLLHFIYPAFAPGIQPMFESVGFPIPGHLFWVYVTGAALFVAGVRILLDFQTQFTATWISIMILVFELLVWAPQFIHSPIQLAGNWLKDLGLVGGAMILAAALPRNQASRSIAT
jgi:uncharacterized membrane protein